MFKSFKKHAFVPTIAAIIAFSPLFFSKCSNPTEPKSDFYAVRATLGPPDSLTYYLFSTDTLRAGETKNYPHGWSVTFEKEVNNSYWNAIPLSFSYGDSLIKIPALPYAKSQGIFLRKCSKENAFFVKEILFNANMPNSVAVEYYARPDVARRK